MLLLGFDMICRVCRAPALCGVGPYARKRCTKRHTRDRRACLRFVHRISFPSLSDNSQRSRVSRDDRFLKVCVFNSLFPTHNSEMETRKAHGPYLLLLPDAFFLGVLHTCAQLSASFHSYYFFFPLSHHSARCVRLLVLCSCRQVRQGSLPLRLLHSRELGHVFRVLRVPTEKSESPRRLKRANRGRKRRKDDEVADFFNTGINVRSHGGYWHSTWAHLHLPPGLQMKERG